MERIDGSDLSATNISKLKKIGKESPMLPLGILACFAIVGHGIYNFRNRKLKPSVFIIHYRLMAQGTLIGCLTLGLVYTIGRNLYDKYTKKSDTLPSIGD